MCSSPLYLTEMIFMMSLITLGLCVGLQSPFSGNVEVLSIGGQELRVAVLSRGSDTSTKSFLFSQNVCPPFVPYCFDPDRSESFDAIDEGEFSHELGWKGEVIGRDNVLGLPHTDTIEFVMVSEWDAISSVKYRDVAGVILLDEVSDFASEEEVIVDTTHSLVPIFGLPVVSITEVGSALEFSTSTDRDGLVLASFAPFQTRERGRVVTAQWRLLKTTRGLLEDVPQLTGQFSVESFQLESSGSLRFVVSPISGAASRVSTVRLSDTPDWIDIIVRTVARKPAVHMDQLDLPLSQPQTHLSDVACSICLSQFVVGEEVQSMEECVHRFHKDCIKSWLEGRTGRSCPICRTQVDVHPERQYSENSYLNSFFI